eukprot:TRINITY_DN1004_c0_g1_i8.p1 TRINITY_DN1004_c0_g1~~TRINITY_DN1004_c0_g1_i8.p1  ORF type:complete len:218 (-),score=67.28 TRINITY_DN1004_c0_g1_i8:170-823(-)
MGRVRSRLTKLSGQLAQQLSGVSRTLGEISGLQEKTAEVYENLNEISLGGIYRGMKEAIDKLNYTFKYFERYIKKEILLSLDYGELEMKALTLLTKQWRASKTQAALLKNKLESRKAILFSKKLIDQWQLPADCKESQENLLNSKELAFKHMLPLETQEVTKYKDIYGYYSNRLKEEFKRICSKSLSGIRKKSEELIEEGNARLEEVIFTANDSCVK